MLASPLPTSFLDTYSRSTSSLRCYVLCMVISFLVLWSICLSSSLVPLRKGPEYLTRGTAQLFIPLIRFLSESFVSSNFRVLLRYPFWILSFICTCLMVTRFGSSIPSVLCCLPLFITSMAHFSVPNSILMSSFEIFHTNH